MIKMYKTKLIPCVQCTNTSVKTCSGWAKLSPFLQLPHIWHSTHQFADFFLPVWGWSGSGSDHSGSLIVSEFLYASLSCHYVAHLKFPHRKKIKCSPTTFLAHGFSFTDAPQNFSKSGCSENSLPTFEPFFPLITFPHSQNREFSLSLLASRGRYVCFCSCPTCKHGRWG